MDARDFPIRRLDHVEFYVGNAKQASVYYTNTFGFLNTAYCGFETGERDHASYVMEQGGIRFLLTAGTSSDNPIAEHAIDMVTASPSLRWKSPMWKPLTISPLTEAPAALWSRAVLPTRMGHFIIRQSTVTAIRYSSS